MVGPPGDMEPVSGMRVCIGPPLRIHHNGRKSVRRCGAQGRRQDRERRWRHGGRREAAGGRPDRPRDRCGAERLWSCRGQGAGRGGPGRRLRLPTTGSDRGSGRHDRRAGGPAADHGVADRSRGWIHAGPGDQARSAGFLPPPLSGGPGL